MREAKGKERRTDPVGHHVRRFLYHGFKFISTAQYSPDIATLWCIRRQLAPDLTDDTGNGGAAVFTISIPYSLVNLAG